MGNDIENLMEGRLMKNVGVWYCIEADLNPNWYYASGDSNEVLIYDPNVGGLMARRRPGL